MSDLGRMNQWQLIRLRFRRHRLAVVALYVLAFLYLVALFAGFFAPHTKDSQRTRYSYAPPQPVLFSFKDGLYVNDIAKVTDPETLKVEYVVKAGERTRLGLFSSGEPYRLMGLFPTDRHLLAPVEKGKAFYPLGADRYGRCILSRVIYGSRISLSIGLISITISFFLGITIGGISGYVGGFWDNLFMRIIEILNAIPKLPLWLALGAAVPSDWPPLRTYLCITLVLSIFAWTRLARTVRSKILSLREEDYAVAAGLLGAGHGRIIFRHLLPGFTSHIIVSLTMSVPRMILGETSLSFLGLGLRPPVVSWGVLLQDCMNMQVVANYPWLLLPALAIILAVLNFNFMGDGLRDAADPYR